MVFLCSVEFCFSLFFFFVPVFTSCSFVCLVFFLTDICNWEALSYFQRPTANIIKKSLQCNWIKCIGRIEIKWVKIVSENWQQIINILTTWVKHLVGFDWKVVYLNSFSLLNSFEFIVINFNSLPKLIVNLSFVLIIAF